jgi:hypothetical protein
MGYQPGALAMNPSLAELLESLKPGLLWVGRDGAVRYANSGATQSTGLSTGRKLYDPDLMRATGEAIASRSPRQLQIPGRSTVAGAPIPELPCKVIPGLGSDDALVLIQGDASRDRSVDYDNLMLAIRADVADPLSGARSALARARAGDPEATQAALAQVDDLLGVMNKLLDLAQLWSGSTLMANDRIELWPLLQAVWAEAEPLARSRNVAVRFRSRSPGLTLATLYGSQPWIQRVLLECLEAAVRSTRKDGALDIEYCQMGPRALIIFRDCGVFRPADDPHAVEMATAPPSKGQPPARGKPAPRLTARDQIGLKLCQHVIAMHGGLLREEDEDGLRNFLIDLPTGAPHRDDHSQLDIEQAQSYARDLSALMMRARRRTAA